MWRRGGPAEGRVQWLGERASGPPLRAPRRPRRRWPVLLAALLVLAIAGAAAPLAWPRLQPIRGGSPQLAAATAPFSAAVTSKTLAPSPSPSPSALPSPTPVLEKMGTPTPTPVPTPPPLRTPAAPAHPPAPPPPAAAPASDAITINVPWQHQVYNLSCEESALSMVMAFYGRAVSDADVLAFIGTDLTHYFTGPGGGDPFAQFVGDPNGSEVTNTGYGVYWPPIKSAATHFGATVAQAGSGISPATVYAAAAAGHPVIVWITFDLAVHARNDYQAFDGTTVPYAGPEEHAMVVSGVSSTSVRVNDPDRSQYWIPRSQFEAAYGVYDQMAVVFG